MTQTVFVANWEDYGSFCCTQGDRGDIDDYEFTAAAQPNVGHVMASFDEQKLEVLKQIVIGGYQAQFDVLHDKEALDELEVAVWHTAEWVTAQPFNGAEPKILGRQEWTLASPEWDISDPDKKGGVEPILRLVVEQHRVF